MCGPWTKVGVPMFSMRNSNNSKVLSVVGLHTSTLFDILCMYMHSSRRWRGMHCECKPPIKVNEEKHSSSRFTAQNHVVFDMFINLLPHIHDTHNMQRIVSQ